MFLTVFYEIVISPSPIPLPLLCTEIFFSVFSSKGLLSFCFPLVSRRQIGSCENTRVA